MAQRSMFEQLEGFEKRYDELEQQLADPAVVGHGARYSSVAREYGSLGKVVKRHRRFKVLKKQIEETEGLLAEETDSDMKAYAQEELKELREQLQQAQRELEDYLLTGGTEGERSLILEIRAGTGGDEAALFARDLFDMYQRYAEKRGWKYEVLEASPTELGGFREVIVGIEGEEAYRRLQFESGGHRVQRVPTTEAQGRIHTSAATVAALPEPDEVEIDIKDDELQIDTFRASGPGGQHVNKTSSAIRITHLPTGQVVSCQDEKSQHRNKSKALRILRSKLFDMEKQKAEGERADQRRSLIGSGDRSQRIRTYNFPQNRVSDHRINLNLYQLEAIMLGELDEFTDALLQAERLRQLGEDTDATA